MRCRRTPVRVARHEGPGGRQSTSRRRTWLLRGGRGRGAGVPQSDYAPLWKPYDHSAQLTAALPQVEQGLLGLQAPSLPAGGPTTCPCVPGWPSTSTTSSRSPQCDQRTALRRGRACSAPLGRALTAPALLLHGGPARPGTGSAPHDADVPQPRCPRVREHRSRLADRWRCGMSVSSTGRGYIGEYQQLVEVQDVRAW